MVSISNNDLLLFTEGSPEKDETKNSHMFFTVHIYQVEKHSKNSKGKDVSCRIASQASQT
jgi:hypothetical protein